MASKRKRTSSEKERPKLRRKRFTLDSVPLSSTCEEGIVLVTGGGDCGQLGLGADVMSKQRPALIDLQEKIVDVRAGAMHTVCLTSEGTVLTFGCNDEGALGRITDGLEDAETRPDKVSLPGRVIQISAGDSHTAALLNDGRVFAWGAFRDSHGSMGLSVRGNEKLPYHISNNILVVKIASGSDHLLLLSNHGEVFTCGCAEQGQLGRTTKRGCSRFARDGKAKLATLLTPTLVRVKPTLRLLFDDIWAGNFSSFMKVAGKNEIYAFGLNNYGQLGLMIQGAEYQPKLSKDFSNRQWSMITCGQHHTIGLDKQGKVYALGRKEYGRLGLGKDCEDATELTEVSALSEQTVTYISCGSATSFAVTREGVLYGWGMGTDGQLGTGSEDDCPEPTPITSKALMDRPVLKVSGGGQHTVILASASNTNNNKGEIGHL